MLMNHQDAPLDRTPPWRELLPAMLLFLAPGALIITCLAMVRSNAAAMIAGIVVGALALGAGVLAMHVRSCCAARDASPPSPRPAAPRAPARVPAT